MYLSIRICSLMHLAIFEAPTFKGSLPLHYDGLVLTMASECWPPIHRKWSIKILFWINYLSFYLATAKIKYEKPKTKNRGDQGKLAFWLGRSGAAGAVMAFILNQKIIGNLRNPILKINQYEFQLGYLRWINYSLQTSVKYRRGCVLG